MEVDTLGEDGALGSTPAEPSAPLLPPAAGDPPDYLLVLWEIDLENEGMAVTFSPGRLA